MNIRRGLIRIWVVLSVLLLIPLCLDTYQHWVMVNDVYEVEVADHRFNVSGMVVMGLAEVERNQVINRMAWLRGIHGPPAVKTGSGLFDDIIAEGWKDWERWEQPLSPKLEALAQGQQANLLSSWKAILLLTWEETWRPILAGLATLWGALYTGFWIVSGFQTRPVR
jgi:hypothetical protein